MSSREIAQLTGKRHDHFLCDIDKLNESYEEMGLLKVEQGYYTINNTGYSTLIYPQVLIHSYWLANFEAFTFELCTIIPKTISTQIVHLINKWLND